MTRQVLFVCIGNSIRSQMAEAFARTYGPDVVVPHSAGLFPASSIAALTHVVMKKKNISLEGQFPKPVDQVDLARMHMIVNISGHPFPYPVKAAQHEWKVADPVGKPERAFQEACDRIENLVMRLILELRQERKAAP